MPIDNIVWDEPTDIVWDAPKQSALDRLKTKSTYGDFARTLNDSLKAASGATSGQSQLGRGLQDVLDSAALGSAWVRDKLGGQGNYDAVKSDIDAINANYKEAVPNSTGMRLVSNVGATLPVGGVLGKGAEALGGGSALVNALRSGGMSTGGANLGRAADIALRTGAAGAVGAAGGAMINPEEALQAGGISALMPAGFKVAGAVGKGLASSSPSNINSVKKAAAENAMDLGFIAAPSQIKPSFANRFFEGLSGKHATEQAISIKNAELSNDVARRYLGLPKDAELNAATLAKYKAEQYAKGYEPIKEVGLIQVGDDFNKALDGISSKYKGKGTIPAIEKKDITNLTESFKTNGFDSSDAIDAIRVLRDNADEAFKKGDVAMAKANRDVANTFENAIEKHLSEAGNPDLLKAYKDARQNIAKSFTIGKAIKEGTGGVEASKIGAAVTKNPQMIQGELRTLGEFANAFPKSMRSPESVGSPQVNALRSVLGLGFGAGSGGVGGAIAGAVAPSLLQSGTQSIMFNPMMQRRLLNQQTPNQLSDLLRSYEYLPYRAAPAIASQ